LIHVKDARGRGVSPVMNDPLVVEDCGEVTVQGKVLKSGQAVVIRRVERVRIEHNVSPERP